MRCNCHRQNRSFQFYPNSESCMLLCEIKNFISTEFKRRNCTFLFASGFLAPLFKFSLKYGPCRDQRHTPSLQHQVSDNSRDIRTVDRLYRPYAKMAAFTVFFCTYLKLPYSSRFCDKNCKEFVITNEDRIQTKI